MRDYGRRYSSVRGRRQSMAPRSQRQRQRQGQGSGWWWQAFGLLIAITLVIGIAATLWFGWEIRHGLDALATYQKEHRELSESNHTLVAQRDRLQSRESIEAAAAALGLYPPTAGQLRRP